MIDFRASGAKSGLRAAFSILKDAPITDVLVIGATAACFAASFVVGNHYPPWTSAYHDMLAAVTLLLLLASTVRPGAGWTVPRPALAIGSLVILPLLQFAGGRVMFFGDAWIATLYLFAFALAIVAGFNASTLWPTRAVRGFCTIWVGVALLSCLLVLVQRFAIDPGDFGLFLWDVRPGHAPFGNLGQPNQLATLLLLALLALVYLFESGYARGRWVALAAALIVVCMALTQSRAGLLLLVTAAALLWFYQPRLKLRAARWAALPYVGLWVACFFTLPRIGEALGLTSTASVTSRLQTGPRTIIWTQLWDAAKAQPWFGYGWNQVSVAQMQVAADFGETRFTEDSHNIVLDLLLWVGFPLTAVIVGVGSWWLVTRARRVRSLESLFGLTFTVLLLTHSMVEFPLTYLYFLVPFGVAVGVVEAGSARPRGTGPGRRLSGRSARYLLATFAAVLAFVAIDYVHFEGKYRELRLTLARVGVPLVKASDPPVKTQFTQLAALYEFPRIDVGPNMAAEQLAWMGRVALRHPYVPVLFRYALAQALNGDTAGAELTLARMKRLHTERNYRDAKFQFDELAAGRYPQLKAVTFR